MKTLVLFITGLLLSLTTVSASDIKPEPKGNNLDITKRYRYAQPVVFFESGIEFMIFPDGSFDFDTRHESYYNSSNSRRTSVNASFKTRGLNVQYTSDYYNKPMIIKDRFGKIIRIGNTPIYYDRMGDVTQIGSVDINYKRGNKLLYKVGGLRVNYNHWGQIVNTSGYVNRLNRNLNYQIAMVDDTFYDSHYNDDYFYYKKYGEVKKLKKNKH
ncbi:hypothetical protein V8G69_09900 [Gaetbulibacter sp. M235]|uniref:hypothetical protein n=1 Tax=Gaetbulibacter sp. M235 TaxID=3126510 RepID=UPI00374ED630